ncbi:MAG: HAD family hydrolase, partial [Myxococcota bacterium]
MRPAVAVAFFDLDKTLIYRNSGTLWLKRELSLGHISYGQAALAFGWLLRYSLGFSNMERGFRWAIRTLNGVDEREIDQRTTAFYKAEVHDLYRPGGQTALDRHRSRGDRLVLLS